ncbi:hypothetical protein EIJ81_08915 [Aliivibrio salmonicida]|nr:hypothetical protein [Aliivibrio salmonicida]AZL84718.1 hypothetical protein EIJ81_08915 [Aliivibrio salmonicida]
MTMKWDHRKVSIDAFKHALKTHGHISLFSLAVWSDILSKHNESNIKVKKVYSLLEGTPIHEKGK